MYASRPEIPEPMEPPLSPPPPPMPAWMRRPLIVVPVTLVLNVLVYLGWNFLARREIASEWFFNYFLVSTEALRAGRLESLIGAAYSHISFFHLLFNMVVVFSFGSVLERLMGHLRFLSFYLIAALVSSLAHCGVTSFIMGNDALPALGASGAACGVLMLFALSFPKQRILVFGLLPVPALLGVLGMVGLDIWGIIAQARGGGLPIGHGAHLGGSLTGLAFFLFFWTKSRQRPSINQPNHSELHR